MPNRQDKSARRMRGRRLQEFRATYLAAHPLCEVCSTDQRPVVATEVDHKVALINGGADFDEDPGQAQALCKACHKDKTDQDLGHKQRLHIGADGWPTVVDVARTLRTKVGR